MVILLRSIPYEIRAGRARDEAVRRSLPRRAATRPRTPGAAGTPRGVDAPLARPNPTRCLLGPAPAPGPATATPTPRPGPGQEHKFLPHSLDGMLVDLKKRMQKAANSDATVPLVD